MPVIGVRTAESARTGLCRPPKLQDAAATPVHPDSLRLGCVVLFVLLLVGLVSQAPAQPPPPGPPQPNPLAQLAPTQPNVDISQPVEARAAFDPPVIRPGGTATYRVTFNAMQASIRWPEEVIAPDALNLRFTVSGQAFKPGGTNLVPQTTFNYRASPTNAGSFEVPRYLVYVGGQPVTVPAAQLEVSPAAPVTPRPSLTLTATATNVYVGQTLGVRVQLPGTEEGVLQTLTGVQLNGEGFVIEGASVRQQVAMIPLNGREVPAYLYESSLTPMRPGRLTVGAQGHTAGLQFSGPITITGRVTLPGGAGQFTLLESEPLALQVRPLPREGELDGFTGAVGRFKLDPPMLSTNTVVVGEAITLSVNVRGDGNLARLVPPPPPRLRDWQVFAGPTDVLPPQIITARGFKTFQFTLIPNTDAVTATPPIPFSCFDPVSGAYVNLTIPAVPVSVRRGAAGADATAFLQRESQPVAEDEPRLTGLATAPGRSLGSLKPHQTQPWFPLVAVLPLFGFLALGWWERHRRFHEAHPEVRVRRRARKALLREWAAARKAAGLGDSSRFVAHAVSALRAACAPHYPAEPRALVSSDVVPLLTAMEGTDGAHVVRRIFAAADAEQFAAQPPGATDVLALRGELERVLVQLEAKL
jgi:hypothetical protein